jgi:hypothetical protein
VEEVMLMANTGTAEQGVQRMEDRYTDRLEKLSLMKLRKGLMFVDWGNSMVESTGKKDRYLKSRGADYSMDYRGNLWEKKKKVAYMRMRDLSNWDSYRILIQLYSHYYRDYCTLEIE